MKPQHDPGPGLFSSRRRHEHQVRQRNLFDIGTVADATDPYPDFPRARNTDPDTSHQAAREIAPHLGDLQREALDAIRQHPGRTCTELARLRDYADPRTFNRRISELAKMEPPRIRCSGTRRCGVTGKNARTWEVC